MYARRTSANPLTTEGTHSGRHEGGDARGEKERLGTIRLIMAAIKQREVDERIALDDTQVLVGTGEDGEAAPGIHHAVRGRRRADLVAKENAELKLISGYLPAQLRDAELER